MTAVDRSRPPPTILENKTCRLKSTDDNQSNLYLTPIVKHDFINPKIKFSDKNETTVLQNFKLELYDNNKNDLYIIKSLVKFPGIMQPALFYAHHSNTFEIRDVYHRMNGMMGGVSQMRNFLFRCADYKIWLNNWGLGVKKVWVRTTTSHDIEKVGMT